MKVFVWKNGEIEELTDSYHSGGGLVVFANDLKRAIELATAEGVKFKATEMTPTEECSLVFAMDEKVYIMPDAGCC